MIEAIKRAKAEKQARELALKEEEEKRDMERDEYKKIEALGEDSQERKMMIEEQEIAAAKKKSIERQKHIDEQIKQRIMWSVGDDNEGSQETRDLS